MRKRKVDKRPGTLAGTETAPRLFSGDDLDLLDAIAAQATEADYLATADLLKAARRHD